MTVRLRNTGTGVTVQVRDEKAVRMGGAWERLDAEPLPSPPKPKRARTRAPKRAVPSVPAE